ncbi:unnamed protein product [Echinostoma caproni]|uniref:Major facilitator superfamily (MFS) profile domain-containing protein n=1 Tax=Echinostoma caproni TaxID=27848 RepID=A0A3P8FKZ3_9TREM|nr:unnamed protein product [Echinostoma caproni]
MFGYDTGVVSGAIIQIRHQFALSYFYQELIISITLVAAAVAALCSAGLTDWLGRKPVILLGSVIFAAGAIVLGVAQNKETLVIGRLIVGLGIGVASMTVPVYIAEIAPGHLRGPLVTLNTVCITGGQCLAGIVDGIFIADSKNGWRLVYHATFLKLSMHIPYFTLIGVPTNHNTIIYITSLVICL